MNKHGIQTLDMLTLEEIEEMFIELEDKLLRRGC
jgi:hypothetical protein